MEVWQVAACLGVDDTNQPESLEHLSNSELIRRRIEASQAGEPEPQWGGGVPSSLMRYGQGFVE